MTQSALKTAFGSGHRGCAFVGGDAVRLEQGPYRGNTKHRGSEGCAGEACGGVKELN